MVDSILKKPTYCDKNREDAGRGILTEWAIALQPMKDGIPVFEGADVSEDFL